MRIKYEEIDRINMILTDDGYKYTIKVTLTDVIVDVGFDITNVF